MNLMSKWVKMINEGTYNFPEENDDVSRTDKGELGADDYEEQQNLLADIQKANEKYENTKTVKEAEDEDDDGSDDPIANTELEQGVELDKPVKDGDHEKEYWDRIQKQIEKIENGAMRLRVVQLAREIFDKAEKKNLNQNLQDREIDKKMPKIIDDINNGSDDDDSVEKSVKELEDLLNMEFHTDLDKTGTVQSDIMKGIEKKEKEVPTEKKWIVFERMLVTKQNATKEQIEKARNDPDFWTRDGKDQNFPKPTVEMNILETPVFDTEREAGDYVSKELSKFANKFHINLKLQDVANIEDPKAAHWEGFVKSDTTKKDITNNYKQTADGQKGVGVVKKTSEYDAIPTQIKQVDPNAFGFMYTNYEDKKDNPRTYHVEIIIYNAVEPVRYSDGLEEFWDGWNNANNPDWKGLEKEKEERRKQYEMKVQDLDKAITDSEKEYYTKEIEKDMVILFNKDKDDKVLKTLKSVSDLSGKTEDELLNMTAEDFVPLSLNKIKYIYGKLEWDAKQKKVDDEAEGDNDDIENLSTDKDIEDAIEKSDKKDSIDGYDTRSDLTQSEKDDIKDTKKREEKEERETKASEKASERENDADDYEGSQGDIQGTVSREMKGSGNTKSSSKLKLHEVPVTQKFIDYLKTKPKSEWPKNADEVKKMKKKMEEEWAE